MKFFDACNGANLQTNMSGSNFGWPTDGPIFPPFLPLQLEPKVKLAYVIAVLINRLCGLSTCVGIAKAKAAKPKDPKVPKVPKAFVPFIDKSKAEKPKVSRKTKRDADNVDAKPRKSRKQAASLPEELVTPPPRSQKASPKSAAVETPKIKATFAKRYRPSKGVSAGKWDALRAAFMTVISVQMSPPHSCLQHKKTIFTDPWGGGAQVCKIPSFNGKSVRELVGFMLKTVPGSRMDSGSSAHASGTMRKLISPDWRRKTWTSWPWKLLNASWKMSAKARTLTTLRKPRARNSSSLGYLVDYLLGVVLRKQTDCQVLLESMFVDPSQRMSPRVSEKDFIDQ